jgi:hypothetical protein
MNVRSPAGSGTGAGGGSGLGGGLGGKGGVHAGIKRVKPMVVAAKTPRGSAVQAGFESNFF